MKLIRRASGPVGTLVVGVALWQVLVRAFEIEVFVFPAPTDIVEVVRRDPGALLHDTWVTFTEAGIGFALGSAIGAGLGILLAYSRFLEKTLFPYVVASNSVPIVAVAPILILIMGEGLSAKVAVTSFLTFFPVCINTMKGLRSTPIESVELMFVQAASRWQDFRKVRLPASAPFVFAGLKVAATFAVIGAIVAEFISAQDGLGNLMVTSNYLLNTPMLFAATITAMLLGIAFFLSVAVLEKILVPWHQSTL